MTFVLSSSRRLQDRQRMGRLGYSRREFSGQRISFIHLNPYDNLHTNLFMNRFYLHRFYSMISRSILLAPRILGHQYSLRMPMTSVCRSIYRSSSLFLSSTVKDSAERAKDAASEHDYHPERADNLKGSRDCLQVKPALGDGPDRTRRTCQSGSESFP